MRRRPAYATLLYQLGKNAFSRVMAGNNYRLLILDSPPIECFNRKRADTSLVTLTTLEQYQAEAHIYQQMYQNLSRDRFTVSRIVNIGSTEELLKQVKTVVF